MTIKSIISETGAAISITKESLGTSTDKGVDMTGAPSALREAVFRVNTELLAHPVKEGTRQVLYRPSQQMATDSPFAGLAGMGGIVGQEYTQTATPYPGYMNQHSQLVGSTSAYTQDMGYLGVTGVGGAYGYPSATQGQVFQTSIPQASSAGPGPGSFLAQQVVRKDDKGERVEQKISIPSVCAGLLIGRGGATIRNLCKMSKASIIIEDATENSMERIVCLKGSVDAIEKAIQLIKQVIESFKGLNNHY